MEVIENHVFKNQKPIYINAANKIKNNSFVLLIFISYFLSISFNINFKILLQIVTLFCIYNNLKSLTINFTKIHKPKWQS
jgi:hypothetical protein